MANVNETKIMQTSGKLRIQIWVTIVGLSAISAQVIGLYLLSLAA